MEAPSFRVGRKRGAARHCGLLVLSVAVGTLIGVSRYRLQPTPAQGAALAEHCGHARYVWNLAVEPAYTSQRCSACGIVDRKARESQAAFRCRSCGYFCNADVNAARNIKHAAGHAVSARGGPPLGGPANREPQRDFLLVG
ncbi:zinc ribbon domain-containing protein [Nonomuraea mangrovi]|uniref:Zinc ribbon domain-containing protein n=1 Tax=Nonomuraea mangrovi TaxID=2316207 RepID=A0ABW4T0C7_9ACTN